MKLVNTSIAVCSYFAINTAFAVLPLDLSTPQVSVLEGKIETTFIEYEIKNTSTEDLTLDFRNIQQVGCDAQTLDGRVLDRQPEIVSPALSSLTIEVGETISVSCSLRFIMPDAPVQLSIYLIDFEDETKSSIILNENLYTHSK